MLTGFKIFKYYIIQKKNPFVEMYFKGRKVLDIGCGRGGFLEKDPINFVGIDINKELIEITKNKGLKAYLGDAANLPFPDNFFDGINCTNVIEHLYPEQALKMLSEAKRVLRPGGFFLISTQLATNKIWRTFGHTRPYPPVAIEKILREDDDEGFGRLEGLEICQIFYLGEYYKNRFLRFISKVLGFYTPISRRGYVMILKKKKI